MDNSPSVFYYYYMSYYTLTEPMTTTDLMTQAAEYEQRRAELAEVEAARVRAWGYFLGAYLTGPIWTAYIANRTRVWAPFWASLALGVATTPLMLLDLGILSSVPAAGLGTYMMAEKSKEKRRKLDIISPEQADVLKFTKL